MPHLVLPLLLMLVLLLQSLHTLMPLLRPYSDARMRGVTAAALLVAFGVFGSLAVGSSLVFGPTLEVRAGRRTGGGQADRRTGSKV